MNRVETIQLYIHSGRCEVYGGTSILVSRDSILFTASKAGCFLWNELNNVKIKVRKHCVSGQWLFLSSNNPKSI